MMVDLMIWKPGNDGDSVLLRRVPMTDLETVVKVAVGNGYSVTVSQYKVTQE